MAWPRRSMPTRIISSDALEKFNRMPSCTSRCGIETYARDEDDFLLGADARATRSCRSPEPSPRETSRLRRQRNAVPSSAKSASASAMTSRRRRYVLRSSRRAWSNSASSLTYSWKTYCAKVPLCRSAPCLASTIFSRISSSRNRPATQSRIPGAMILLPVPEYMIGAVLVVAKRARGSSSPFEAQFAVGIVLDDRQVVALADADDVLAALARERSAGGILKVRDEVENFGNGSARSSSARAIPESRRLRRSRPSGSAPDRRRRLESLQDTMDFEHDVVAGIEEDLADRSSPCCEPLTIVTSSASNDAAGTTGKPLGNPAAHLRNAFGHAVLKRRRTAPLHDARGRLRRSLASERVRVPEVPRRTK